VLAGRAEQSRLAAGHDEATGDAVRRVEQHAAQGRNAGEQAIA
jgi:hypothetical protein